MKVINYKEGMILRYNLTSDGPLYKVVSKSNFPNEVMLQQIYSNGKSADPYGPFRYSWHTIVNSGKWSVLTLGKRLVRRA